MIPFADRKVFEQSALAERSLSEFTGTFWLRGGLLANVFPLQTAYMNFARAEEPIYVSFAGDAVC